MQKFVCFVLLLCLHSGFSFAEVRNQGVFVGPVKAKVWKHWQPSWNVEDTTFAPTADFTLTRGFKDNDNAFVSLAFKSDAHPYTATLSCDILERDGAYDVKPRTGFSFDAVGAIKNQGTTFQFEDTTECLDEHEKRFVTKICFAINHRGRRLYDYCVTPMYVRGKSLSYWKNDVPSYSAHAGSGQLTVANNMSAEKGWDLWDGILVKPILNFVDRNTLLGGGTIGLHQHSQNQEMYFIESGQVEMIMGLSELKGNTYTTERKWSETGEKRMVEEFQIEGGWVERRILNAGELSVIAPDPNKANIVYFHGIKAIKDSNFWTMGSRN